VQSVVPQPKREEVVAAAPEKVEVPVVQDAGNLDTVFFDYDSSVLTPEALRLLNRHAEWLQENQEVTATIEGHCDERGSDEYNLALGERRATVARDYLVAQGITPGRLAIVSYGEQRPATGGHDEAAWEKNRRIEFR
jgi:peptidoglycan-associated lipoprotein